MPWAEAISCILTGSVVSRKASSKIALKAYLHFFETVFGAANIVL
jgi:hypothetical protein